MMDFQEVCISNRSASGAMRTNDCSETNGSTTPPPRWERGTLHGTAAQQGGFYVVLTHVGGVRVDVGFGGPALPLSCHECALAVCKPFTGS